MEEKDILQPEQTNEVAQEQQPAIEVESQMDGEVASFDQQPAQVEPAPPVEVPASDISKDIQKVSAEEKKDIEQIQKQAKEKAAREYRGVFGDRQIRKTNKAIGLAIGVVAILLIAFFVVTKIPMFYNCMVPSSDSPLKTVFAETNLKEVEVDDDVWAIWYEYDEDTQKIEFELLPGSTASNPVEPSTNIFANLDPEAIDEAESFYQMNWLLCKKMSNSAVSEDIKYVTVIWYQFDDVEDSKEYAEIQKAKYADGRYEHKNALFYQLGMVKGTGDGYVYDAWYNGGNYIEIYASDAEFAELVRTEINYNV